MDAPEEPQPPVVYTMENKPIVTCKCGGAGGRGARPGLAAPIYADTADLRPFRG